MGLGPLGSRGLCFNIQDYDDLVPRHVQSGASKSIWHFLLMVNTFITMIDISTILAHMKYGGTGLKA